MSKPLPITIGAEFFRRLRESSCLYVDKTALLNELFFDNMHEPVATVTLITRPRRFGKTLTMTMLRDFFDIRQNSKEIFAGLEIAKNEALCNAWMNKYPVVFVSLKGVDGFKFEEAIHRVGEILRSLIIVHKELLKSELVELSDRVVLQRIYDAKGTPSDFESVLNVLSRALYAHYGNPAILLIDEYDVPLAKARNSYYPEMVSFISNFMGSALKTNNYLKLAVLTGCLRISKESIFTGLNNFNCYTISDKEFSDKLGFTEQEVSTLLQERGLTDKKAILKEWYNGYRFGDGIEMYCPWDVLQHISRLQRDSKVKPKPYWANSSGNDVIRDFIDHTNFAVHKKIEKLLANGCVEAVISETLTYDALYTSEDNFWTLLYLTGYLTKATKEQAEACGIDIQASEDAGKTVMAIPNKEVKEIYTSIVAQWFLDTVRDANRSEFFTTFWSGNAEKLSEMLTRELYKTISYYDSHENYYHAFLTGLFAFSDYEVSSNTECGLGRPDLFLLDLKQDHAAVIEVKRVKKEADMEKTAKAALQQIEDLDYSDCVPPFIKTVQRYGIVFYKKKCFVLYEEYKLI